jgi:hypothetical protein
MVLERGFHTYRVVTMKPTGIFKLISENLTNLGGPMGTEHTFANWVKYFDSVDNAKEYAMKDYTNGGILRWTFEWVMDLNGWRSPDLGFVMYHINEVKVEK